MEINEKRGIKFNSALIIDDEELDLFLSKRELIEKKITDRVFTETSVRSALHFLRNTIDMPELIFIDYKMIDFLRSLSKFPYHTTRECKVFMLSYTPLPIEKIVEETESERLHLKYMPKPIDVDLLLGKN